MNFFNLCKSELQSALVEAGFERFRATQLFTKVYRNQFKSEFLPAKLQSYLKESFTFDTNTEVLQRHESTDGTIKSLLSVGCQVVESVLIPSRQRRTLCVSSQVGCSLACKFCHTGTQKLERNLQTCEIVGQFLLADNPTNVVFMGQGEPLYNWRNVARAVKILTDTDGLALGRSKITISTSGIAPLIPKIASELGVNLAVSLHAPVDDLRSEVMPINDTYNLKALMDSCNEYVRISPCSTKRISFEYVMLDGINDSPSMAKELILLLKDIPSHINLIPFNPWPGTQFKSSPKQRILEFRDKLNSNGLATTIRWSKGDDILAACGQLKSKYEKVTE